jgi:S-adenosylmethionine synthetase
MDRDGGIATGSTTEIFTSESVAEGHPDKVADYIADSVLDDVLSRHPRGRVACEVLCKRDRVVLAGEIDALAGIQPDYDRIVRQALVEIGYSGTDEPFTAERITVSSDLIGGQAKEIARGVDQAADDEKQLGAGDQGMMYGYATAETPELMPLPAVLAHRIMRSLAGARKSGGAAWLRPDAKGQVSVEYREGRPAAVTRVLVSSQHAAGSLKTLQEYVRDDLLPRALGDWWTPEVDVLVNPAGEWTVGGPAADAGVTGRKIIVDTYGGMARHGGGAFSGKDPTKVDRTGAYFCRYVARKVVQEGLCERAEVRVSYAIGVAAVRRRRRHVWLG